MPTRAVGIADTTLRSLSHLDPPTHATVGRLLPILSAADRAGFRAIDVWGDMPFEHALKVLNESPWERLRSFCSGLRATPAQMSLLATSLVGSRPHSPSFVDEFVKQAADCGVRSFVVLDAMNDARRVETTAAAVRAAGADLSLGVVHPAGAHRSIEETVTAATRMALLEPDVLCIKTASALGPRSGPQLVKALRSAVSPPVHVDLDNAGGMAPVVAAMCAKAGAEVVYASAAPVWMDPAGVSVAAVLAALGDLGVTVRLDRGAVSSMSVAMAALVKAAGGHAAVARASSLVDWLKAMEVPAGVLHRVGERLLDQGALERLPEVLAEMLRVRAEMGVPTLARPLDHMAATQAVLNVLYGRRWQVVPDEMKAFLRGEFGTPPTEPSAEVLKMALGDDWVETDAGPPDSIACLDGLRAGSDGLAEGLDDLLLEALAPAEATSFFRRRQTSRRLDSPEPAFSNDSTGEAWEDEWENLGPDRVRELIALLEASNVDELSFENKGTRVALRKTAHVPGEEIALPTAPTTADASSELPWGKAWAPQMTRPEVIHATEVPSETIKPVLATMVGTLHRRPSPEAPVYVEVGQKVSQGDVLCILEAMKLMNEVIAEFPGTLAATLVEDGAGVEYGQPLFLIETADE